MANVKIDATDFLNKSSKFVSLVTSKTHTAVNAVADEILRLSQFQVPHDTGQLQNTGHVEQGRTEMQAIVGYNKVYAARLHEHPEYRFGKGRKGKYLEDPIKNNIDVLRGFIMKHVREALL